MYKRQQLDYLKKELAKHGWTCQEQSFEQETSKGPIQFVNLRARFGKAPDFQAPVRGLLTCHIDTKQGIAGFTGANDGASGAAAILETVSYTHLDVYKRQSQDRAALPPAESRHFSNHLLINRNTTHLTT